MDPFEMSKLAGKDTKMFCVGSNVKQGSKICCLGGAIVSPSEFYLNLKESWNDLEKAQKELDNYFEETPTKRCGDDTKMLLARKDDPYYIPNSKCLEAGLYIAVLAKIGGNSEWHRGQILKKLANKKYKVILIDYGDVYNNFTIENIRYIPEKFLNFPAQAIRCKLDFGNQLNKLHSWESFWNSKEQKKFFRIMKNFEVSVEFRSYDIDLGLVNCMVWLVKLNKYGLDGAIRNESVAQELVQKLGEKWVKHRDKEITLNKQTTSNITAPKKRPAASIAINILETDYDIDFFRQVEGRTDIINVSEVDFKGVYITSPQNPVDSK